MLGVCAGLFFFFFCQFSQSRPFDTYTWNLKTEPKMENKHQHNHSVNVCIRWAHVSHTTDTEWVKEKKKKTKPKKMNVYAKQSIQWWCLFSFVFISLSFILCLLVVFSVFFLFFFNFKNVHHLMRSFNFNILGRLAVYVFILNMNNNLLRAQLMCAKHALNQYIYICIFDRLKDLCVQKNRRFANHMNQMKNKRIRISMSCLLLLLLLCGYCWKQNITIALWPWYSLFCNWCVINFCRDRNWRWPAPVCVI